MAVQRYVVLLDADHAVTAGERDYVVGRLVEEDVPNYARTDGQFWITHEHVVIEPPGTGPGMFDSDGD